MEELKRLAVEEMNAGRITPLQYLKALSEMPSTEEEETVAQAKERPVKQAAPQDDKKAAPAEAAQGCAQSKRKLSGAALQKKLQADENLRLEKAQEMSAALSKKQAEAGCSSGAWTCQTCTLVNEKPEGLVCDGCGTERYGSSGTGRAFTKRPRP